MTHQNHQTNGASLEDCHTNFFALTELYGIKWRKLVWGENSAEEGSALSDPVISSYARCLAGDILCVWRRVPAQAQDIYDMSAPAPPPLSLRAAKELWIFWYGEEPDLNGLVAPELIGSQGDQGSWESGLSYECRSLLFKALHNLIERCLLSRDFVRLGKWFVQPYDGDEDDVGNSPWHLSFSFAFFLHGESTVCASVDVRQHPAVRTLTAKRLSELSQSERSEDSKVILAPFGLEGTVTGRQWSDSDAATARLLDAWRQLYPLEHGCGAVEVVCGGVRMRYPRPYVVSTRGEPPAPPHAQPHALPRRALNALTTTAPHTTESVESPNEKLEDFVDPTRKTNCTCAKWRRRRTTRGTRPPPFHRRPRRPERTGQPHRLRESGTACSPGSCGGGSPAAASAPPSAGPPPPSPHPPPTNQSAAVVPTTLHTPAPTPDPLAPPTPATHLANTKLYNQGDSPPSGQPSALAHPEPPVSLGARPVLPRAPAAVDPLEDEHSLHMLYDYTTVHAWLEHPVKRFKTEETTFKEELALGSADGDLYAGHQHTKMAAVDHTLRLKHEKQEPYEDVKEYKRLFTSDGLCPTLKDLDQMFDNSDDASGDETHQVSTPPECKSELGGRMVRAEELSKMFPTPPSLEAHAQASPGFSLPDDIHGHTHVQTTHGHVHTHGHAMHHARHPLSPPPDPIEDWSFVFKPPTVCKYVGSSKYAPLPSLPSQLLPPVALPANAVYRPRWGDGAQHRANVDDARTTSLKRTGSPLPVPRTPLPRPAPAPSPPRATSPPPAPPRAACPLLLNVLLADTVLNVFRDHNFDSCTLCVCNAGPRVVGNILGSDASTYLSGLVAADDDAPRCSCGFSAVINRRLAHHAGLFYEDEMEITGVAEDPCLRSSGSGLAEVAGVVLGACAAPPAAEHEALARAAANARDSIDAQHPDQINVLEYSDGGLAAARALRSAAGGGVVSNAVHRWAFIAARAPRSTRDVVRLMRRLRPLLQDAIQKRCHGARMWDSGVSGPLTWRQFHRLAGRGNDDLCEPQPVPPLLVGHDRDWLSLSPYALRHWERLALEPYAYARDIAYVVLAPHCDDLTLPLKAFFRELTSSYEACRLGRHTPLTRIARDGIIRAGPQGTATHNANDEWVGNVKGKTGLWLRAYAEALRTSLVPALASLSVERLLGERERESRPCAPATPDHPPTPSSQSDQEDANTSATNNNPVTGNVGGGGWWEEEEGGAPALVVYVVEPPLPVAQRDSALTPLLRLATALQHHLHHHNPLVKIISLEGVCESWGVGSGPASGLRALAFSVFSGARRLLAHRADGKSLTGFGTAANANLFLQTKDKKNRAPYKLFSPAWVLAPPRALKEVAETWGQGSGSGGGVLFVSYCLSHDQRWLLAAACDARGELIDTAAINIHVPARSRRRVSAGARRLGLTKLMDFMLGVMSHAAQPWRLVVGRVGRIGHGELKGWSWLLSRKNLMRASNVLKEICSSCSVLYPSTAARDPKAVMSLPVPCILSACLVSTEPDSCLRLMADRFTPDERFSQASIQSHLHTPRDVTATHILVFPTSATTQSNQMPFEQPMANGENDDMNLFGMDMGDEDMGEDNVIGDLFIGDMFTNMWAPGSPRGSPRRNDDDASRDGSPHRHAHAPANNNMSDHEAEQVGAVLQQPLALGYMVSTAPLNAMPAWWWAGCSHLKDACPAFLKNALHLHAGSVQSPDDYMSLTHRRDHNTHPLDSQTTTDVLRYVLEGYNALSWLALDGTTHDRVSCLPLHVQVLMQLYHTAAALG